MATAKITAEQLAEYVDLEQRRKELDRQSRALAKQQGILANHFQAALEKAGQKSTARGSYRVALIEGKGTVAWKEELIKQIGPLKVAEIAEAAPTKTRVQVETVEAARKAA